MILSYKARCFIKRLLIIIPILVAVILAAVAIWTVWAGRFVLYTRSGAVLDFSMSCADLTGKPALPPEPEDPVDIFYNEGSDKVETSTELAQLSGYYVTGAVLEKGLDAVYDQLKKLPAGTPVMVDMKSIYGNFFYSSSVSPYRNGDLVTEQIDELIRYLSSSSLYTIARVPALRDRNFGLDNTSCGLVEKGGGGWLWSEPGTACYWLDPSKEATVTYLIQIGNELKGLGFDEVVFYDFCFPDTDRIVFKGNKTEALTNAAQTVVTACATDRFAVSFTTSGPGKFTPPIGRSRIFLEKIAAANVGTTADGFDLEDKPIRLVFVAQTQDTRYDEYGVMRPLEDAH